MEGDLDRRVSEARAYAREQVDAWQASGKYQHWGTIGLLLSYLLKLHWVDGPQSSYIDGDINLAGLICTFSNTDSGCRVLASEIVATRILNDQPLTDDLKTFAYRHLRGDLREIKKKRGGKMDHTRDLFLITMLNELKAGFGLNPTQNDEKGAPSKHARTEPTPPSGAEILSDCFCDIGHNEVTPKAIKEVWKHKKKRDWANLIAKYIRNPPEFEPTAPKRPAIWL